jgi:hypothetical protein
MTKTAGTFGRPYVTPLDTLPAVVEPPATRLEHVSTGESVGYRREEYEPPPRDFHFEVPARDAGGWTKPEEPPHSGDRGPGCSNFVVKIALSLGGVVLAIPVGVPLTVMLAEPWAGMGVIVTGGILLTAGILWPLDR